MQAKRILRKSEIKAMDYVNICIEASASSCRFLTVDFTEYKRHHHITRANINCLLVMPFGSGKTTSLVDIENAVIANDFTAPSMLGTITREGKFSPGFCMLAGGKILLIDEFQNLDSNARRGMLSLLEYPHTYKRYLGWPVNEPITKQDSENGKWWKVSAEKNEVSIYSKFSCIASGMHLGVDHVEQVDLAWLSRFMPIRVSIDLDYIDKLTYGVPMIRVNPQQKEMGFEFKSYKHFHDKYMQLARALPFRNLYDNDRAGFASRNMIDLARLSCFFASLSNRTNVQKDDWQAALKFLPVALSNYVTSGLSHTDYLILNNFQQHSASEMAEIAQCSERNIFERLKILKKRGLIPLTDDEKAERLWEEHV